MGSDIAQQRWYPIANGTNEQRTKYMSRITIELTNSEMEALKQKARRDLRQPKDQARYLLRSLLLGTRDQSTNNKSAVSQTWQGENGTFAESTL